MNTETPGAGGAPHGAADAGAAPGQPTGPAPVTAPPAAGTTPPAEASAQAASPAGTAPPAEVAAQPGALPATPATDPAGATLPVDPAAAMSPAPVAPEAAATPTGAPADQAIALAADHSIPGLILQAGPVVQGVMLALTLASVVCWAIMIEKAILLGGLRREIRRLAEAGSSEAMHGEGLAARIRRAAAPEPPVVLTVTREGAVHVGEERIAAAELSARLAAMKAARPDIIVHVRGDRAVAYGEVLRIMGRVTAAGIPRVSLIAEAEPAAAGAR